MGSLLAPTIRAEAIPREETMPAIECSIEINRPVAEVFAWIEDPEKAMLWQESVTKGEILEEREGKVGTRFREYVEEDGKGTWMTGEITEFVPTKKIGFALDGEFNSVNVRFEVKPSGEGCQVTQKADIRFKGAARVFGLLAKKQIEAQMKRELGELKRLCEAGGEALAV